MEDLQRPRLIAERLLTWLAADRPALPATTPLELLTERLGVDVLLFDPQTQRQGVLGWLEPGENVVYLRTGLPEPVRRFTLAHELGHYVLHRRGGMAALDAALPSAAPLLLASDVDADGDVLEDCDDRDLDTPIDSLSATDETLRPGQAYSARARREREANIFAASLLLSPARLLPAYLEAARMEAPPRGRRRLRELADRFAVSEDVLLRQLATLLTPAASIGAEGYQPSALPAQGRAAATLDPWQHAAAASDTPALVVAGPGTGKTSTLVARVAHLVAERGVAPQHVLALTFSNKAAREMRERLHALLGARPASNGEHGALPTVSTIHAFCGDLLRRYAPLAGLRPDFRLVSETDGYFLLRELAGTLRLAHYQPLSAPAMYFPALLAAISRAKDELCEPEEYAAVAVQMLESARTTEALEAAERACEVAAVYQAYQSALATRGDGDFGDMIRLAVRVLREHPEALAEVRDRYHHVLVDEFQDINRAMGVLLRVLAGDAGPLWAVGDADQAIYRFRGASPANLSQFTSEYPSARVHTLRQNYRSRPIILEAAAALAGARLDDGTSSREPLRSVRGGDGGVTLALAPDEAAELAGLVAAIQARAAQGRPLGEQVVLCRTRRQCQRVAAALQAAGVKTRLAVPMLEYPEIKDVLAVLSLAVDGSGMGLLRAGRVADHAFTVAEARAVLAAARERRMPPVALLRALPPDISDISLEGQASLGALREVLAELQAAPDVATGLARYVFGLTSLGARLLDEDEDGAPARAMAQLLALARAFEDRQQIQEGASTSGLAGGADWGGFLDYVRIMAALRQEAGGSMDEMAGELSDGVRVLTVHGSKGLEFPVVYLPGLADRRFPIQRRGMSVTLPDALVRTPAPADDAQAHVTEEACLFYVAITRARDELVLSYAERYGRVRYRLSPFLAPLAARLGDRIRYEQWTPPAREQAQSPAEASVPAEELPSPDGAPMPIAAVEAYNRCPRQYAYRYLYQLRTREVGLATLRRAVHETLDALYVGLAPPDTGREIQVLSLEEARALFEEKWAAALEREWSAAARDAGDVPGGRDDLERGAARVPAEQPHQPAREPFIEIYRQHGNTIVERAWLHLTNGRAADLQTRFDTGVTVRVGEQEIAVTLDRVEHRLRQDGTHRRNGRGAGADEAPLRIVRHRLGRSEIERTDLRMLLYELAVEQSAHATRPELQQHNLATGETGPIRMDGRKLARLRERLDELLEGMRGGVYPPKPDPMICPTCPYFLICPA